MASSKSSPDVWRLRWRTFRGWTGPRRRLALEAYGLLGVCRLLILALPFKFLAARLMGWFMAETLTRMPDRAQARAADVGWAVRRMADHTPWQSTCLAQALAAQNMLRRRGLGSTVYLGVARHREATQGLEAHAWLRCGDAIVTGAEEMDDFQSVASYALDTGILYRPWPPLQRLSAWRRPGPPAPPPPSRLAPE